MQHDLPSQTARDLFRSLDYYREWNENDEKHSQLSEYPSFEGFQTDWRRTSSAIQTSARRLPYTRTPRPKRRERLPRFWRKRFLEICSQFVPKMDWEQFSNEMAGMKKLARNCNEKVSGMRAGRGERIRTSDLTVPNRTRYQAALRPDRRQMEMLTKFPYSFNTIPYNSRFEIRDC